MTIRPCEPGDAAAIEALFHDFVAYLRTIGDAAPYRFSVAQYLRDGFGPSPAFRGLLAEDDSGAIIGYVLFSPTYDGEYVRGLYVVDLYVRRESRNRGIGRLLMRGVTDVARTEGRTRLSWAVHENNRTAISFYESLGAVAISGNVTMYLEVNG